MADTLLAALLVREVHAKIVLAASFPADPFVS